MTNAKGRILVVDDESYIREILAASLEDAGYEAVTASGVDEALSLLANQNFDIVLTDIRMPGRQGTELLQEVRDAYPEAIVLVLTAVDSTDIAIESLRLGAYDYILKPFNLEQVQISVERAFDKKRLEDTNREYQKYLGQIAEERTVETRRLFYSMTQVLIRLLDIKIPFNEGHALRVAEKARYVARELGITDEGVRKIYLAALLHDVGAILVEDKLLNKLEALTGEEQQTIQERTVLASDVLRPILDDEEVLRCIRHTRERYDGTGYPDGIKENLIPLGARIISVIEAFDAMTMGRPYRLPLTPAEAIHELQRCSGTQFDPQVVMIFNDLHEKVFQNPEFSVTGGL